MKLIAYNMSEGGGMNGGFSSISVTYTDNGRCKVTAVEKSFHNQPIKRVRYYADGLLEKLNEVCESYNVITWTDLPAREMIMLDEASRSDSFTFENGTAITLNNRKIYPDHVYEMKHKVNELIKESETYGTEFETTEEDSLMTMGMMVNMADAPAMTQKTENQEHRTTKWAVFCADCGTKFKGDEKFCSECGSVRQKL